MSRCVKTRDWFGNGHCGIVMSLSTAIVCITLVTTEEAWPGPLECPDVLKPISADHRPEPYIAYLLGLLLICRS